ncbi:MAG: hypothetical protein AAGG79_05630 [Pseudomonadota bacterium]
MTLSTADRVREVHRVALQQSLSRSLKTDQEWYRFHAIARETAERIDAEKDDFRHDYQIRLGEARQVILREQNARALELSPPGVDTTKPPSPEKLDILAMNRVQADHEHRIAAILTDEVDAYRDLRTDVRARTAREAAAREQWSGKIRESFNRTNQISPHLAKTQGRSGPSRS